MDDMVPNRSVHGIVGVVLRSSAKTVHFMRHAQGTHNKAVEEKGEDVLITEDHSDAKLTDLGKEQCAALKAAGRDIGKEPQLVVVSPLTRTIETALLTMDQVDGIPWIALDCVREMSGLHPCNRRRPIHEVKKEYPTINFDFIAEDEDRHWYTFGGERETKESVAARGRELIAWIAARPETNIAVVTHAEFLSCLFTEAIHAAPHIAKRFENAEVRTVLLDV